MKVHLRDDKWGNAFVGSTFCGRRYDRTGDMPTPEMCLSVHMDWDSYLTRVPEDVQCRRCVAGFSRYQRDQQVKW